ncbi:MAG: amidohydrolase [Chloroflexi bacterium]|nr:amidohydrolase [Chloroflexota bacterium]
MTFDLNREIDGLRGELVRLRRDFHRHPELGFQENRTAGVIAKRLTDMGLEVNTGIAKTGVIGLLKGEKPGRTLLLRADIDALPISERNRVSYRSRNEGVMHACGHDAHIAVLLTAASVLARHRDLVNGNVKFAFQPAEEQGGGAKPMIEEGVLRDPDVDAALGLHVWNNLPVGVVGIRTGPTFASADEIKITIKGRGGHGAMPHQGVDAIAIAGQVITTLQNIVSRTVSPLESAVVTIGKIEGGTAFNVLADRVVMKGTVRAYSMELRKNLLERVERVVQGVALALGGEYEFESRFACPPVVNDARMTKLVGKAAASVVGKDKVVTAEPTMGADDMSYFLEKVPGCYFRVGSANPGKGADKPHHHPEFDIDEEALPIAAKVMLKAALDYLR